MLTAPIPWGFLGVCVTTYGFLHWRGCYHGEKLSQILPCRLKTWETPIPAVSVQMWKLHPGTFGALTQAAAAGGGQSCPGSKRCLSSDLASCQAARGHAGRRGGGSCHSLLLLFRVMPQKGEHTQVRCCRGKPAAPSGNLAHSPRRASPAGED